MPDKRVTELPAIDAVTGTDLVLVVDDPAGTPVSKKATAAQLLPTATYGQLLLSQGAGVPPAFTDTPELLGGLQILGGPGALGELYVEDTAYFDGDGWFGGDVECDRAITSYRSIRSQPPSDATAPAMVVLDNTTPTPVTQWAVDKLGQMTFGATGGMNASDLKSGTVPTARLPARLGGVGIVIDGGGAVITTGTKGFIEIPFAGTIIAATLLSTDASATSGSIVIDVWKDAFANYPPVTGDSITASAKPTLSSAAKSKDTTLTGWTTSVAAGDVLGFNVTSATTVTRVTLTLTIQAT